MHIYMYIQVFMDRPGIYIIQFSKFSNCNLLSTIMDLVMEFNLGLEYAIVQMQ